MAEVATPPLACRACGEPDWLTLRCYAYGHAFGVSGCFALRVYTRAAIKLLDELTANTLSLIFPSIIGGE